MRWNGRVKNPSQEGDGPCFGEEVGQDSMKGPPLHVQATPVPLP